MTKFTAKTDWNHPVEVEITHKDDGGVYVNVDGKNAHLTAEQAKALQNNLNTPQRSKTGEW